MRNRVDRCASCGRDGAVGTPITIIAEGPLEGEPRTVEHNPDAFRLLILMVSGKTTWVTVGPCCAESPDLNAIGKRLVGARAFSYLNRAELDRALGARPKLYTPQQRMVLENQIADDAWDAPLDVLAKQPLSMTELSLRNYVRAS